MAFISLFEKQAQGFRAKTPIIAYVGGIQCGKTTLGGLAMQRAILTHRNPDDNFIIAAPDYKTLSQATLPKFLKFARGYGRYNSARAEFKIFGGGTIYCRTATHPESVEGISDVRFIWADEAGLLSRYFYENLEGRAAMKEAPILLTTTPYAMNWLSDLAENTLSAKRTDVTLVQLKSIDSPYFPKHKYEEQKKRLDPRRFAMKYEGLFGQMEGLVFPKLNLCPSFQLPAGTKYVAGVDWGYNPDPFALVVRARTADGLHYRVAEYYKNFLTISQQVKIAQSFKSIYNIEIFYCDPSQPGSIQEFNNARCPAVGAQNDIRLGIDKHDDLIRSGRFWIFEEMNPLGIDEYKTYHYPEEKELHVDKDSKELLPVDKNNHGCDADRYVTIELEKVNDRKHTPVTPSHRGVTPLRDNVKRLEWLKKGGSKGRGVL